MPTAGTLSELASFPDSRLRILNAENPSNNDGVARSGFGTLPAYLEALVMQCLSKEPAERYESMRAVLALVQSEDLVTE